MEMTLLWSISILLAFSILVLLLCYRFKVPEVVGVLLTGIIAGPSVLGIVGSYADIGFLAEIGVVLLLFTIGMEFSFKRLLEVKKEFFVGGTLQVLLTFGVVLAGLVILGGSVGAAQARRAREVALLKVLGVTRAGAAAALGLEFALVGLVAGLVGTLGAALLSGAVLEAAFEVPFRPDPALLAGAPVAVALLAAAAGLAVSARALRVRPLEALRSE